MSLAALRQGRFLATVFRSSLSKSSVACGAAPRIGPAIHHLSTTILRDGTEPQTKTVSFQSLFAQSRVADGTFDASDLAATVAPLPASTNLPIGNQQPEMVQKFVNCMMQHGKKATSQKIFNDMLLQLKLEHIQEMSKKKKAAEGVIEHNVAFDAMKLFLDAMENLQPVVGTRPVKRGGTVYQVPTALHPVARRRLAIRWIINVARKKKGGDMATKLAKEIKAAYNREGLAYAKKLELHKTAEANRAYAALVQR